MPRRRMVRIKNGVVETAEPQIVKCFSLTKGTVEIIQNFMEAEEYNSQSQAVRKLVSIANKALIEKGYW